MMKRALVVAGLILLGAALVFLNQGVRKSAQPDHDEDEQAQKAPATQQPTQQPGGAGGAPAPVLLPEETFGDPAKATHHIQVGWVYDEKNQGKPEGLTGPIQTISQYVQGSGGRVSAEVVDLDVPPEDRSPAARAVTGMGIKVDGRSLFGGNPSDVAMDPERIVSQLNGAIRGK